MITKLFGWALGWKGMALAAGFLFVSGFASGSYVAYELVTAKHLRATQKLQREYAEARKKLEAEIETLTGKFVHAEEKNAATEREFLSGDHVAGDCAVDDNSLRNTLLRIR